MRIFNEPNASDEWKCPICKKNTKGKIALLPIHNTQNGNIAEAEQFHVDCIDLVYMRLESLLIQRV